MFRVSGVPCARRCLHSGWPSNFSSTRKICSDLCREDHWSVHVFNAGRSRTKLTLGSHELVLSTGETFTIPPVVRKFLWTHLWACFARQRTDENENDNYNGRVSRSDVLEICNATTSDQENYYSTLDQIKVMCGSENFEAGFWLVQDICDLPPTEFTGYEDTLKTLMTQHKQHCKTVLSTHLSTTSKRTHHCITHLFGGQGPKFCNDCMNCGGHSERCKDCDSGTVIILIMQGMIDKLFELGTFVARFAVVIGHVSATMCVYTIHTHTNVTHTHHSVCVNVCVCVGCACGWCGYVCLWMVCVCGCGWYVCFFTPQIQA